MTAPSTACGPADVSACALCSGCVDANLTPLLAPNVIWLWQQLATAADRRGDPELVTGAVSVVAPADPEERAAVVGLLPGKALLPGVRRRIELAVLHDVVRGYGGGLTPGAVVAHAIGRPLATTALRRRDRAEFGETLRERGRDWAASSASPVTVRWDDIADALQRTGWVARLWAHGDGALVFERALAAIDALPPAGLRVDRRVLAGVVASNPHALDAGEVLPAFILAILTAAGAIEPRSKTRDAWDAVGVDCDDLTGGLVSVGVHPVGWQLPADTAVTLPPRVLATCNWAPPPVGQQWVFVTENPSVASAASELATSGVPVHLLCTSGTPSAIEVAAIARLAVAGWRIAVRADFDVAGLAHVAAVLAAAPDAVPWRMSAGEYRQSVRDAAPVLTAPLPDTPWDTELAEAMRTGGVVAFEETLLEELLGDLRAGLPRS